MKIPPDKVVKANLTTACSPWGGEFDWAWERHRKEGASNPKPYVHDSAYRREVSRGKDAYLLWAQYPDPEPKTLEEWSKVPMNTGTAFTCFGGPLGAESAYDNNEFLTLMNKGYAKVRGSKFDMGTFLGEGRETLQTIGDIAVKTSVSIQYLRAGQLGNALKVLGSNPRRDQRAILKNGDVRAKYSDGEIPANMWLEWTYGIKPVLSDAKTSMETLSNIINNRVPRTTYRVRGLYSKSSSPVFGGLRWSAKCDDKVQILFRYSGEPIGLLDQLNLANPLAVAWETTKLSFVFDWFLPVGDYLHAVGDSHRLKIDSLVISKKTEQRSVASGHTKFYVQMGDLAETSSMIFTREVIPGNQVPLYVAMHPPQLKPLFEIDSWKHAVSGISLLLQLRK